MTELNTIQDDYSWNTYDEVFKHFVSVLKPNAVLDIGAGSGKYGKLVRQVMPEAKISGVEIDEEGAKRNQLEQIYDEVITIPTTDFLMKHPDKNFDLVVIGDCIEHMFKSVGLDLLNYLNYRSAYVLIITPDGMVMNKDPYYLGHISNWTERDLMWHDNFGHERVGVMQLFLMRGLLRPDLPTLGQFNDYLKSIPLPLYHDNGAFQKNFELTLVNQMFKWESTPGTLHSYRPF
ncbi:methyltransferase domain-containing protein [Hydromonas duriensis]|uniref:Methyltransferase family protein n=1 Tax=Hydromonas duriensis TaxID=1527608 RepID=A0A4R6Y9L5_9BURK|nr:methyltransferase domain-containing protein [Hydromonas duriensis]TDR32173.1 methyltransferase family protein [Hydromonas duriensis]